jgi:CBS domain containing-hemolysin-like protein
MVAPILTVISRLTSPFVTIIERSSAAITRMLGVHADHRTAGGHSTEELKLIVSSSRFAGHLPRLLEDMIHRAIDLEDLAVREIMQPRHDVVSVPVNATLDEVLETMVQSQHSRLPVWEEAPEHMVGVVFFKDMLRLWHERRNSMRAGRPTPEFRLERIMRKPLIVPETKPLLQMLEEFRQGHTHMALIVDEFGTVSGLVTVEDVLEQIVGEIEDEFDEKLAAPQLEADEVEVSGATSIRDFSSLYGVELPANAGFETIAGYILYKLGHIPEPGEALDFEDRRLTVSSMDKNRIATVLVKRMSKAAGTGAETAANARN